jgi:hypothetical protein
MMIVPEPAFPLPRASIARRASVLIRSRNEQRFSAPEARQTCGISRIHKQTQIVDARRPDNPCRDESPHDYRTEKRTFDHG